MKTLKHFFQKPFLRRKTAVLLSAPWPLKLSFGRVCGFIGRTSLHVVISTTTAMNTQTRANANLSGQKNHGLSCGFFSFWTFFWQKKRTLPPWKRFLKNSKKRHTYGISGDLWPLKLAFSRVCVFIVRRAEGNLDSGRDTSSVKCPPRAFLQQ